MPSPTPVIFSEAHRGHDGLVELFAGREIPCWESPARAETILGALLATGRHALEAPEEHGPDPIAAVHDLELIDLVENAWADAVADGHDPARSLLPDTFLLAAYRGPMSLEQLPPRRHLRLGAYCFDTATPIVAGTAAAARAAVDVALTAVDRVLEGGAPLAYGLCRPPGHHAGRNLIGGYCFFNNAAIAAQSMRDRGAERVAILDVDFHHGNGTQQLFWERGDVLYVSLHGDPRVSYPYYSGFATERGAGDGEGATLNFPLPPGTDGGAYLATLDEALAAIRAFDADAPLVVSLGFDTYETDPISSFALRTDDYARMGARIAGLGMPAVVLQEGGYAVDAIGRNAVAFLGALRDG
ncbi:MAG TPA: histone deacetylase family protein [Candidatus Limnocylindria bacterium]|jgi:acetoin utilization deacetylase AcuC-like enzyme|nr:histone deacetylase family protein [Candidatus Limnocylindria bacterium]